MGLHDLRLAYARKALRLELIGTVARQGSQLGLDLADGRQLAALATPAGLASGGYGLIARTVEQSQGLDLMAQADLGAVTLRAGAGISAAETRRDAADTQAGTVLADRRISQNRDSVHGFAQLQLDAGHGLTLDAGLRVDRQTLILAVNDRRAGCSPCLTNAGPDRQADTLITPDIALSWRATKQLLIFARSARNARLPGWNLLARTTAELAALPAETGWQHAAGVKVDLWQHRLRIDASGFVATTRALVSPLLGIDPLAMAANPRLDMNNHGLDVVAEARPFERLALAATFGWQQARWAGAVPPGAPDRPLYAPDTTASLSAEWRQPLVGTGSILVPRIAARWRSAMAVGPALGLADGIASGGWQVAAALQLEIPGGGWLVSLECENCLDQTLTDGAVAGLATLNPPRWWQMRFTRRF
jgi:iron complex outermembrane receptor protein